MDSFLLRCVKQILAHSFNEPTLADKSDELCDSRSILFCWMKDSVHKQEVSRFQLHCATMKDFGLL